MAVVLNDATAAIAARRAEVARVRMMQAIAYEDARHDWRAQVVQAIAPGERVLDVGKSMRDWSGALQERAGRVETLDLHVWADYPDLVADLCQPIPPERHGLYDTVIALAVLECVYDPQAMVDNVARLLRPGGRAFLYAPFLFQYHAPVDGAFQDNYRFSRDGLAYLMRGFERVELTPVRGRYAAAVNLLPFWKRRVEGRLGATVGRWLDRFGQPDRNALNASGYNVVGYKPG